MDLKNLRDTAVKLSVFDDWQVLSHQTGLDLRKEYDGRGQQVQHDITKCTALNYLTKQISPYPLKPCPIAFTLANW